MKMSIAGGIGLTLLVGINIASARETITITDLGHLGGNWSEAVAVNEAGAVAGNSKTPGGVINAFKWESGVMVNIWNKPEQSKAIAINSAGDVLINAQMVSGSRAYVWRNGELIDIGTLGGATSATDINDAGEIVGNSKTSLGKLHAFHWQNGTMTDLGTLGGDLSYAVDINNAGQVVGTSSILPYGNRGFLWYDGSMIDLGHFPNIYDYGQDSYALRINEGGSITGYGNYFSHYTHPFFWKDGVMMDIGEDSFFGDHGSSADINDLDQVVGSFTGGLSAAGFMWQDGGLEPVGPYNRTYSNALRVNDNGEAIGYNYFMISTTMTMNHAFTWKGGRLTYLPATFGEQSEARALNNSGQIAGINANRAVLWSRQLVPDVLESVGMFRGGAWYLDKNGNKTWDAGDSSLSFGNPGDIPVSGRWDGGNTSKIGVFRDGTWYLDVNGNGTWDAGVDMVRSFGTSSDIPVVGDWTGNGTTNIGVFRNGEWFLDLDGNGTWGYNGSLWGYTDAIYSSRNSTYTFGIPGDKPVTGDWDGSGTTKIGVVRGNTWYLDMNGNGAWDDGIDAIKSFGLPSDVPITGDWTGSGTAKIGVVCDGSTWFLDMDGNGGWEDGVDQVMNGFGIPGDLPVTGKW